MADKEALHRALAQYARTLIHDYSIGDLLYQLTDQVVTVLGVAGAGVSLADPDGKLQFVTATNEHVVRLEEQQMLSAEGPCHDAYHSGKQILVSDLNRAGYWESYTPVALKVGCLAVAGIPMRIADRRIGALDLYADLPREWAPDDIEAAQLLADMAAGYIVNAREILKSRELAEQLQQALDSRVVIEQAKGILAERREMPPEEAFDVLRDYARSHNRKLHDVATAVVQRTLRL